MLERPLQQPSKGKNSLDRMLGTTEHFRSFQQDGWLIAEQECWADHPLHLDILSNPWNQVETPEPSKYLHA